MIKIILRDTGEALDLPPNIKISVERNNVMFKDNADYILPLTLPLTSRNNRALNFPLEIAAIDFGIRGYTVLVQFHGFQFVGNLKILSVSKKGINITIVMGNYELYNQIGGKTLSDCFKNIVWDLFSVYNNPVLSWVNCLEQIMVGNNTYDLPFAVFPVVTKVDSESYIYFTKNSIDKINTVNLTEAGNNYLNLQDWNGSLYGKIERTTVIDDVQVTFPIGYNVTPFLKLWWVLDKLFESFGFEFNSNFFKTGNFEKLCVLNNTRDSLLAGKIFAEHLIPDGTVSEFLYCIRNRFGCEFVLDEGTNKVDLLFYKDILKSESKNYTPKLGSIHITYAEKKTLKLSSKKSVFGDGQKYKIFQELNNYSPNIQEVDIIGSEVNTPVGNYFDTSLLKYYKIVPAYINNKFIDSGFDCLDFFDEDSKLSAKELNSNYTEYSELFAIMYSNSDFINFSFPYIIGKRNKVSNLVVINSDDDTVIDNNDVCPVQFCYQRGKIASYSPVYFGSAHIYTPISQLKLLGVPNMAYAREDGLFQWFFKEYDAALRNGMHKINCKLNLTTAEIVDFDFYNLVNIQGQNYIPVSLRYEITQEKINIVDCELLLVKL